MRELYHYRPLNSDRLIRVLELLPAKHHDNPIQCRLIERPLDVEPLTGLKYEALSYVWGSNIGDREILCEGRTLLVTPNCEAALRRFRRPKKSRILWIDAICIDQSNLEEKGKQVPLMADVYHLASRVLIWLGNGTKKTARGFRYLHILAFIAKATGIRYAQKTLSIWFLTQRVGKHNNSRTKAASFC